MFVKSVIMMEKEVVQLDMKGLQMVAWSEMLPQSYLPV